MRKIFAYCNCNCVSLYRVVFLKTDCTCTLRIFVWCCLLAPGSPDSTLSETN